VRRHPRSATRVPQWIVPPWRRAVTVNGAARQVIADYSIAAGGLARHLGDGPGPRRRGAPQRHVGLVHPPGSGWRGPSHTSLVLRMCPGATGTGRRPSSRPGPQRAALQRGADGPDRACPGGLAGRWPSPAAATGPGGGRGGVPRGPAKLARRVVRVTCHQAIFPHLMAAVTSADSAPRAPVRRPAGTDSTGPRQSPAALEFRRCQRSPGCCRSG